MLKRFLLVISILHLTAQTAAAIPLSLCRQNEPGCWTPPEAVVSAIRTGLEACREDSACIGAMIRSFGARYQQSLFDSQRYFDEMRDSVPHQAVVAAFLECETRNPNNRPAINHCQLAYLENYPTSDLQQNLTQSLRQMEIASRLASVVWNSCQRANLRACPNLLESFNAGVRQLTPPTGQAQATNTPTAQTTPTSASSQPSQQNLERSAGLSVRSRVRGNGGEVQQQDPSWLTRLFADRPTAELTNNCSQLFGDELPGSCGGQATSNRVALDASTRNLLRAASSSMVDSKVMKLAAARFLMLKQVEHYLGIAARQSTDDPHAFSNSAQILTHACQPSTEGDPAANRELNRVLRMAVDSSVAEYEGGLNQNTDGQNIIPGSAVTENREIYLDLAIEAARELQELDTLDHLLERDFPGPPSNLAQRWRQGRVTQYLPCGMSLQAFDTLATSWNRVLGAAICDESGNSQLYVR